ncbi:MAG: serine hydrolase [Opitutaceae bacterium]|nr:serine hydrolase [Opitutaceae bacterium]
MTLARLVISVVALLCAAAGQARPPESQIRASLTSWLGESPGGVAAAYIDADGVVFAQAGRFSAADDRSLTPDTQFEIGSVTKTFTAVLLADAVRASRLALEDPVGPPFARSGVTYLQLATHTAGLPPLPTDLTMSDPLNPYADSDLPALTGSFAKVAAGVKPSASSYSNFGFSVLGHAVAGAWDKPYGELLTERVLRPLQLPATRLSWRDADPSRLAPPHDPSGIGRNWDLNAFAPAGSLVSSTRDLARYVQAHLGLVESPLAGALADTQRARVGGGAPTRQSGLAWVIERRPAGTRIWHNGATGGYRSYVGFDPDRRAGVVVLTNHARGVEALGEALLAGVPLADTPAQRPVAPDAGLVEYLGNYPLAASFILTVTAEGKQLYVQGTNQPRLKVDAMATDRFKAQGVAAEVSFERDAAGKVVALVLHQNGADRRAPRLAPGEKPAPPREVALPAEELEAYVGRYALGPLHFTVTREARGLFVQVTGQPKAQVFASARDEFFYKVVEARISFVRAEGRVVALILHQAGLAQRAVKEP